MILKIFASFNIFLAALRNLSSLYRKQGRSEAADILEKAMKGSKVKSEGIKMEPGS
jgi:hypothetical protein